jgi:hypothetical protein
MVRRRRSPPTEPVRGSLVAAGTASQERVLLKITVPRRLAASASPLAALVATLVASLACWAPVARAAEAGEEGASASSTALYGYEPLTPWRQPPLRLPNPQLLDYGAFAETGIRQAANWRRGGWYCELLGCAGGAYPLATIWASVPVFETADALQTAEPTPAHLALVDHIGHEAERFWDAAVGGYAPYPGDRGANTEVWFDDNGWWGLAFLNAYRATHQTRWLYDAQRALRFIASRGWDAAGGGGMWWNTDHPYHSGPALASDTLLAMLLYEEDHEAWQLEDAKTWVNWANANDNHDERRLYLEKPNDPESVNDYVQAPLIYAQYLLCKAGAGEEYCTRAGRVAATLVERHVSKTGYRYDYGPEYDTIFLQWMMAYGQATGESYWLKLAEVNAAAAARHAADSHGLWLSSWWGGPIPDPETHPNMIRTVGATASLFAWLAVYAGPHAGSAGPPPPPSHGARVHKRGSRERRGRPGGRRAHRGSGSHKRAHRAHRRRRHRRRPHRGRHVARKRHKRHRRRRG